MLNQPRTSNDMVKQLWPAWLAELILCFRGMTIYLEGYGQEWDLEKLQNIHNR